jgi:N-acyl-D-amino-acid deacylase
LALDLVVRGGTVLDGTGADPFAADVGIENGRIEAIGVIDAPDTAVLDATGLFVAPGFIDIHSHSDHTLLVDPRAMSAILQGVTLEVVGNCGHGYFPIHDPARAKTAVYGCAADAQPFAFQNASEYFERLEETVPAVNVLSLVPNGQLRFATVGLRDGPLDRQELGEITRLLEESLDQGAWGYSTGLEYAWEGGATEDEIVELCTVVAKAGGIYATHTRRRDEASVEGVEEALRTAERSGVRLQVSHIVPRNGLPGMRGCVESVEAARARGVDAHFDMHTRLFGLTYFHVALPPEAMAAGPEALAELLASKSAREEMKSYRSMLSAGGTPWSHIVLYDNAVWPEYARRDIASIAEERGQEPLDAVYDILLAAADDTRQLMVILHAYNEAQQREIFAHPLCMPGSDATTLAPDGPLAESFFHGAYTWASWFYRFMACETKLLTPAEAVHRLAGLPAEKMGLRDRGVLKPGARADVAVFDGARFEETATTFEPNQLAHGMLHVLVNGVETLRDGELTGKRAGEVLRRR